MTATLIRPETTKASPPPSSTTTTPAPGARQAPKPRRKPSGKASAFGAVTRALTLLGLLVLGFGIYLVVLSPVGQSRTQENLFKTFSGQLALATAPVDGTIPVGAPVAILQIPSLGVSQVVVEGTTSGALMNGPGHRRDSVLPGQAGTSVVLGRSGLFGAPFADLADLEVGDSIVVTTGEGRSTFSVSNVRESTAAVPPSSRDVVSSLVLSSAAPPLTPTHSLIVTATLTSAVLPGATTATVIGSNERSLAGDPGAAVSLLLWLQLLLLTVVATTWGFLRWERWPTYLLATPVVLAVLWNVYESAAQLLPNTM